MAENRVEIVVVSRNDTRGGFEQAKLDAEKAGDEAGKGFMSKFGSWLIGGQTKGLFGNASAGGGLGGVFSTITSAGIPGIAALTAVVGALLVEVDGLVAGFTAAAAGAGAFIALALPAFKILQTNYSQLVQNQNDFGNASQNIATAIASSAANAAQYQKSLADPATRDAVKLLSDQNTVWQNLTTSQQNSLVALDNNKKAMALLLPDQKTALGILMKEQDAWSNLTPSQQKATGALDNIRLAYDKMSLAFQPTAFTIFGDALKVVSDLMPKLVPLATAFANAFGPLLVKLDQFVQSKGFQQWFQQFLSYVGPATTAIGTGLGQVAVNFGKLLTVLPPADVVRSIGLAFGFINSTLQILTGTIKVILGPLGELASLITAITGSGGNYQGLGAGVPSAASFKGMNFSGLGSLGGKLPILTPPPNAPSTAGKVKHFAAGGPASGLAWVGEQGPELVDLPGGSYVHPAGSFSPVIVQLGGGGSSQLEQIIWNWMVREVRVRGGGGKNSVQIALGQTH